MINLLKKLPLWTVALPVIFFAGSLQLVYDAGERGTLRSSFLRDSVYPQTRMLNGAITNIKFRLRGPNPPKNKIVIIEADNHSVDALGRWPWHREIYAQLVMTIFKNGARNVSLDVAYPEAEERVPKEVYDLLSKTQPKLVPQIKELEGDPTFAKVIEAYQDKLVLGYSPIAFCQPGYFDLKKAHEECPVENESLSTDISSQLDAFALKEGYPFPKDTLWQTPLFNIITAFSNIPLLRESAKHAGAFFIAPDDDGFIRRYPLFFFHEKKIYPSLALSAAMVARGEEVKIDFSTTAHLIEKVYFPSDPNHPIPVTPLGNIDLNFRGPHETFTYLRAVDVLKTYYEPNSEINAALKDASVFFGVTALGLYDMRAFPFDSNVPGVEGHATALDNLLSNDMLRSANNLGLGWIPLFLILSLGVIFAFSFSRFEAIPSLLIFATFFVAFGFFDVFVLFRSNINLPSAFLLAEIIVIFVLILAIRYILEERNKKFVREAFSKYLAPQVVDLVLKDPSKLTVGGERKNLTILFSDLRNFTSFSEKMDPKTLSQFLNEYLSEMTDIVFDYEGTLDKYIGDAVMCFWGAPLHQENHAELAWKAAVAMQKRLRKIAPQFKAKYGIDVSVGIGINSGDVSVGNMGSKRIFEYTVIGDHVNLASRLEGLTRLYGCDILSTTETLNSLSESVRAKVSYRKIDSVIVKGKTQAVDLIQISDIDLSQECVQTFQDARAKLRDRAWDDAIDSFARAGQIYERDTGSHDQVAELFIERCREFKLPPPREGWDGTIEMRRK